MPDGVSSARRQEPCLFCGEPERVEVFEIWDHNFALECCCEGLHETVARDMADDPEWAKTLLRRIGMEELAGHRLRRLADVRHDPGLRSGEASAAASLARG